MSWIFPIENLMSYHPLYFFFTCFCVYACFVIFDIGRNGREKSVVGARLPFFARHPISGIGVPVVGL